MTEFREESHDSFLIHYSLIQAIYTDSVDQVQRILETRPTFRADSAFLGSSSPLHYACSQGALQVLTYFHEDQNCDFNSDASPFRMTCGMVAALNNQLDIVRYLWQKGCTFRERDMEGDSILHKAAINSELPLLQFLVEETDCKDLLISQNHKGQMPVEHLYDMSQRKILPKQLTEAKDGEAFIAEAIAYLGNQTNAIISWQKRKRLILVRNKLRYYN